MNKRKERKRRWLTVLAIVAGVAGVHAVGLILFHAEPVGGARRAEEPNGVSLLPIGNGRSDSLAVREQAVLLDSAPLFLPTRWNAVSDLRIRGLSRRPGELFSAYPPELSLENVEIGERRSEGPPPGPLEGLQSDDNAPLRVFRGAPSETPTLPERAARVQVVSARTGEEAFAFDVEEALPEGEPFWAPLVFGVHITSVGVGGAPVLLESSGVGDIDGFFSRYLREEVFTRRLPEPGYYRVFFGP